jgi:hypothetical protein
LYGFLIVYYILSGGQEMRRLRRAHQKCVKEQDRRRKKLKKRALAAGIAAAITLGAGVGINKVLAAYTPDPHELPVAQDADGDLLADVEEAALAYLDFEPDQNRNAIPDGVELAKLCAADINNLPWENEAGHNDTYKWWDPAAGLQTCDICGAKIGMGWGGVINPSLGITVGFPLYEALHYMEHGSFSYSYSAGTAEGRIDVPALLQALELRLPSEPNDHQLPVPNDSDSDLLSNKEELAIGYQPFNDDQNENAIPDGIELAKRCAIVVGQLPDQFQAEPNEIYKIEHALDGTERCHICGQDIHMGGWEIINPKLNLKYPDPCDPLDGSFLPDLALHYMQHGSFDCYGDNHQGRVSIARLMRVLELRYPYEPNDHQLPLNYKVQGVGQLAPDANDLDGDLLTDSEEIEAGFDLHDSDQNKNLVPDGIELAKRCAETINQLPDAGEAEPNEIHKGFATQWGLETCDICGKVVNMGGALVTNPRLDLTVGFPILALHYMEHGSFNYLGDVHSGRIDVAALVKALEIPRRCGDLGTLYLPGDYNKDCEEDFKDFADFADKWLKSTDPNQD